MKKITLLGVLAILCLLARAQQPALKPLTIGDTVPDITISKIINYKTTSAKLSDFKGKLVILDFWAVWCSGCIQGMPKLDSLQKEFKNKLQVILINDEGERSTLENEKKTKAFFDNLEIKSNGSFTLPSSLKRIDSLEKLFPHIFIPHYVWVGPKGKVIAITNSQEINRENIKAVLDGSPEKMPLKADRLQSSPQN